MPIIKRVLIEDRINRRYLVLLRREPESNVIHVVWIAIEDYHGLMVG